MANAPGRSAQSPIIIRLIRSKLSLAKSAICAAILLAGSLASASIIVDRGTDNTGTDNVLANACDPLLTGPDLTVQGCLNTDHAFLINFTSDESIKYSGGQASIAPADTGTPFSFLKISLATPGWTFNKLLLNIDSIVDGFVTFISSSGGASSPFELDKNGENKFTLTGEDFLSIAFETTVGVESVDLVADVKQVRIGGIKESGTDPDPDPDPMPVPGTLMLLGLVLLGLGWFCKDRSIA